MAWTTRDPDWIAPTRAHVADLHWLAYADAAENDNARAAGIAAVLRWIHGGADAPVTGRTSRPMSRADAEAELWAARTILRPDAPPPLADICQQLGLAPVTPRAISGPAASGVAATLSWLLGREAPPLVLPARRADGSPADVAEIVEAAISAQPHRSWGPEERHAARQQARAEVAASLRLLDRIAAAQARVG